MATIAVTGAASGIGATLAARLADDGHRVIGVDLAGTDVEADLGTAGGRTAAIAAVADLCDGRLDALLPFPARHPPPPVKEALRAADQWAPSPPARSTPR